MYCSIPTVPVAFYWACSDDTVHYESHKTVIFGAKTPCEHTLSTVSPEILAPP